MRTSCTLVLAMLVWSVAHADVPPPRSIQVFFDPNMQTNWATEGSYIVQNFYVLAYDLPGDVGEYRFHLEFSDSDSYFGITFPEGVENNGSGDDYILNVTGDCLDGDGLVVLATGYILHFNVNLVDATLCLTPIGDVGPDESGLDYRPCASSPWEDLTLLYPGCAVFNPYNNWPAPIINNDPNYVVFNSSSVDGEPTDSVTIPINWTKTLLKSGDPTEVHRIVLDLTWNPAVATYDGVTSTAPADWTITSVAGPGVLNLTMEGPSAFDPPFSGDTLANVSFVLSPDEGSTTVNTVVAELLDLDSLPILFLPPSEVDMAVTCEKGDVVPNGDINAFDAFFVLEFAALLEQPTPKEYCRAEMNYNGMIDSGDAVIILATAVGEVPKAGYSTALTSFEATSKTLRMQVADAAGVDLSIRWDPDLGSLVNWDVPPSFHGAHQSGNGELRLALVRTDPMDGEIVLVFDTEALEVTVDVAWIWGSDGMLAADHSGESYVLGQTPSRLPMILPPSPNPFNPSTMIRYMMPNGGWAEIRILDARGRLLWMTHIDVTNSGPNELEWWGIDMQGRSLGSGSYIIELVTKNGRSSTRATLIQ